MKEVKIKLNDMDDAIKLVNEIEKQHFDVDVVRGRYTVDGSSLMGILGIGISEPLKLEIFEDDCPDFIESISSFII